MPTLLAGPGGMPLGLGLNEGLGITGRDVRGVGESCVPASLAVFGASPWRGLCLEFHLKLSLCLEIERLPNGLFQSSIAPDGVLPSEAWGVHSEGRTMGEALMKAAWGFEHLEGHNPSRLHKDYPALLQDIQSASGYVPWRPRR